MSTRLPKTFQKLVVQELSTNFREATKVVSVAMPEVDENEIIMKTDFVGINASDINFTKGRYTPGVDPPFDCGFESVGVVAKIGDAVTRFSVGDAVATMSGGAFAEYQVLSERMAFPVPESKPEMLPLLVSGLTASISCDNLADFDNKKEQVMLVTAASGGTGQFACQFGKMAGCHVIGTCGSDEKRDFLQNELGVDRVVNYKKEDLKEVLEEEYDGLDIVYECVGGDMFETALNNLAVKGRLIVIGSISSYKGDHMWAERKSKTPVALKLLAKSASIRGFFLNNYIRDWKTHLAKQVDLLESGNLVSKVDVSHGHVGLKGIADAIDYMYSGKNIGKVVVPMGLASKSKL